jgi:hypothetical protein
VLLVPTCLVEGKIQFVLEMKTKDVVSTDIEGNTGSGVELGESEDSVTSYLPDRSPHFCSSDSIVGVQAAYLTTPILCS